MNEHERAAILQELAQREIVYRVPGSEAVQPRGLTYRSTTGVGLPMDIYYPSANAGKLAPIVVVAFGYTDPDGRVRRFGPLTSWARLLARSGIATVLYGTAAPATDLDAVLSHLRQQADTLGLDTARIGLFATSGNAPVALSTIMRDGDVRCAALLCGYTMDMDGSTVVRDMAAQAGFVDACVGRSVDDLPASLPMLFVRAGHDQFPGLNDRLDQLIARGLARNLSLTLINHPPGGHGFDIYEQTALSERVIRHVVAFLQLHLVQ